MAGPLLKLCQLREVVGCIIQKRYNLGFWLAPNPSLGEIETNTDDEDATNIISPIQVVKNHEEFLFKNNINEFQGQTSDGIS